MAYLHTLSFRVGGLQNFLPSVTLIDERGDPILSKNGDYYIVEEDEFPQYLLMGFNESYFNTKLLRIPLKTISTEEMTSKDVKNYNKFPLYVISGYLDNLNRDFEMASFVKQNTKFFEQSSSETLPTHMIEPFASVIAELRVPLARDGRPVVMSRQSKAIVTHLDEIDHRMEAKRIVMNNKMHQTIAAFTIYIESHVVSIKNVNDGLFNSNSNLSSYISSYSKSLYSPLRQKIHEIIKAETTEVQQQAYLRTKRFNQYGKGMERYDLFTDHSFWEDRPINAYLFNRFRESSAQYWIRIFEYVMMIRKTEYGLESSVDSTKMYMGLPLREQLAVMTDMFSSVSVSTVYLSDYILDIKTGLLTMTDDFSNVCEGSGDCEDMHLCIYDCAHSFVRFCEKNKGVFDSEPALDSISQHATLYNCCLCLSALNCPSSKPPKMVCHMTALFLHTKWMLNHIDTNQISDMETIDGLQRIRQVEAASGHLKDRVINKSNPSASELYTPVLFAEGTGFIYPYQEDDYSPKQYLDKKPRKRQIPFPGLKYRKYQSNDWKYHLRYILLITNFFIDYKKAPKVNLPSMYFSYRPQTTNIGNTLSESSERGIESNDLYAENHTPTREIVLIPQVQFSDVKRITFALSRLCMDKFSLTPHYSNSVGSFKHKEYFSEQSISTKNKSLEGRIIVSSPYTEQDNSRMMNTQFNTSILSSISPNISYQQIQDYFTDDSIPNSFKGLDYFIIPASWFRVFIKYMGTQRLRGQKYIELNPDHSLYLCWYQ